MEEVFDIMFFVKDVPCFKDVWWCEMVAVFIVWIIIEELFKYSVISLWAASK